MQHAGFGRGSSKHGATGTDAIVVMCALRSSSFRLNAPNFSLRGRWCSTGARTKSQMRYADQA